MECALYRLHYEGIPGVPAIYLYRDPVEIIASVRKSTTAVLEAKDRRQAEFLTGLPRAEIDRLGATAYLARCYSEAFTAITDHRGAGLSLLDYEALEEVHFAEILDRGLDFRPSARSLAAMQMQFATYSKDDSDTTSFDGDRARKTAMISDDDRRVIRGITGDSLQDLRRDDRNIFAPPALRRQASASTEEALLSMPST